MDLVFNSRYPFSSSAKKYVESARVKLDDGLVEKGKKRASLAITKGRIPTLPSRSSFGLEEEIMSYAVARMIISGIKATMAIERYAVAEAKRASSSSV